MTPIAASGSANTASRPPTSRKRAVGAGAKGAGERRCRRATRVASEHLVVFTPSGKRGRFPEGTSVLEAARKLGADLDSVCGGRGICGRCQVVVAEGDFPKHGIASAPSHLTGWNSVEARYTSKRGDLAPGRRLGCQARLCGNVVIDVPADSQVHRQVVRKQ